LLQTKTLELQSARSAYGAGIDAKGGFKYQRKDLNLLFCKQNRLLECLKV